MRINVLMFLVVMASTFAWPSVSYASSASDAMNFISNGSTSLETANRKVYTGGSMRMFVPQSSTQFVSITPPSYSAGCSGIDVALGGFSFINGDQLKSMVQSIMGSAKGYALDLAIRTLCPICSDVMQKIRDVSNWANNLALDSCGAATSIVDSIAEGVFEVDPDNPGEALYSGESSSDYFKDGCKQAASGEADWWDKTVCTAGKFEGIGKAITSFISGVNSGKSWSELSPEDKNKANQLLPTLNKTYAGMVALGFKNKDMIELMISAIGTSYIQEGGSHNSLPGWSSYPTISISKDEDMNPTKNAASILTYLLMFGRDASEPDVSSYADPSIRALMDNVKESISSLGVDFGELPYYQCNGPLGSTDKPATFLGCRDDMVEKKISDLNDSDNKYLSKDGYLTWVAKNLVDGADRMKKGEGLTDTQLGLINSAPLPVYKMMKVAALYPEAGKQLVASYSHLIAMMLIKEQFQGMIKPEKMQKSQWEGVARFSEVVSLTTHKISQYISTSSQEKVLAELQVSMHLQGVLSSIDRLIAEKAIQSGAAGSSLFTRRMTPSSSLKGVSN